VEICGDFSSSGTRVVSGKKITREYITATLVTSINIHSINHVFNMLCQHKKESNGGRRKDEARPLVVVSASGVLQCFDTVGWVTGRAQTSATDPQRFSSRTGGGRQLTESGSPGKRPLKRC